MNRPWVSTTMYACRFCGAELFLTKRDAAEHLIDCEQADPTMRKLARQWLDAGAPLVTASRSRKRRASRQPGQE